MEYDSQAGLVAMVHNHSRATLVILSMVLVLMFTLVTFFIHLLVKAARREMFLCAALIQQKEATQQAERKSMKKSLAFAMSSHDIRNSLAALNGIIDVCIKGVPPNSETAEYLECMKRATASLVDLLNSVLDTSKIESGKMQLMEEKFSLVQAIEESVNLYYHNAMDKGIDLVLDPCDGSAVKQGLVKGDCGRLKQVLNNLLHNAIKFTPGGHIVVRAWTRKPSPKMSVGVSKNSSIWNSLSRCSFFKHKEPQNDLSSFHIEQQDQNLVELIIEVDDTGKGIPKEKQKSVFEDFVQARETSLDRDEGTGLGLGIVQSLVRLMGGDIRIMDKDLGEKGTCFRFNIFLSTCENVSGSSTSEVEDSSLLPDRIPMETNPWNLSPRAEVSNIVLFMKPGERRRALRNFLQGLGAKLSVINTFEQVSPTLERIKRKGHLRHLSSPGQSDVSPISESVSVSAPYGTRDVNINIEDESDIHRRTINKGGFSFVLIIVDYSAVQFSDHQFLECYSMLESFKKDVSESRCKVVWLYTPQTDLEARQADQRKLASCEIVMSKPLHGSRLLQILKLLPEFGGAPTILGYRPSFKEEVTRSSYRRSVTLQPHLEEEITQTSEKVLSGKNVLVAEDVAILQRLAKMPLERHGASVTLCGNGEEALKLVSDGLRDNGQSSSRLPYDLIFMDCEMPIMNGIEATRQIRLEEKLYNVRLPIIALTAHEEKEEHAKILLAGVDAVMTKPLNDERIYQAVQLIDENM